MNQSWNERDLEYTEKKYDPVQTSVNVKIIQFKVFSVELIIN